jgi:hypothetical protein
VNAHADGNVRSIATSVDQAVLMFSVTRAGNDPGGFFHDACARQAQD